MASEITGVSIVYSIACLGADQRTLQSSASLNFVRGFHRWPENSPHKEPVSGKYFHLMRSSWWFVHGSKPSHFLNLPYSIDVMSTSSYHFLRTNELLGTTFSEIWRKVQPLIPEQEFKILNTVVWKMLAILFSVLTVRLHCYVSLSINGSSQEDLINRFNSLIDGCKNKMRIDLWGPGNQQILLVTY